ncbi:type I restriction modification system M subunit (site-specific DNA-methyltransferase subunit) [Lentisphaera araneosa HTCC2155]|jgi:type I restriction enzyme M protein|uniref:site-specific DNA-methyltransferase (adenine-specific) n=1 Tax=Lentisphaera araneosa HTCC2155 TaxID=313628 RepID=A6DQ84_9BACT|nr:class I SAM-dependent DNA methyltransferase [Lentisphaera araneosa]EDM26135.1 type I restriction modification system M subunit (site-specific DNA-methyltransferase subunit) [Lentisphaera araneosa HTCC2155]
MITGEIKNKIDRIWDVFWEGGLSNPLTVVEQLTYLLFIKGLDELQSTKEATASMLDLPVDAPVYSDDQRELRWSAFKELEAQQMFSLFTRVDDSNPGIFQFIKNLHGDNDSAFSRYMTDALFQVQSPKMLQRVVEMLDEIPMQDRDTKGDIYEYLLSKIATSGTLGQFRTPRHIIDLMVDLMRPTPQDTIIDPASGSCGFLVSANNYLRNNHKEIFTDGALNHHFNNEMFYGHDMDSTMLRIGAMNMMLHGVENPNIDRRDSLGEENKDENSYSLILANPPFKGALDFEACSKSLLAMCKTKKTELLFLALMIRSLKLGGRCAVIVPDGVLFGSSKAHKQIREQLVEKQNLEGVISMPSGVFKPYAGVSTAILLFTKTDEGGTDKVWFYDMKNDGFSLDDKRAPIEGSDLPDIIKSFHERNNGQDGQSRTAQSFFVPKEEIIENGYDLSINRYKEIVYEEVQYDEPEIILDRIDSLEKDIVAGVSELREMVKNK